MLLSKVQIKLYAESGVDQPLDAFIPLFHSWIQQDSLGDMVYDVANYMHVPRGPGVLLVGHGSDYALDEGEGRPGLLYSRKRDLPSGASLVTDALRRALKAVELLNAAGVPGPSSFSSKEILFSFTERLHVINDDASFELVRPTVAAALAEILAGSQYKLTREGEPREPLTIRAVS